MKSTSFSQSKNIRKTTNSLRKDLRFIKKPRVKNNRHQVKSILQKEKNMESIEHINIVNNGAWYII